MTSAHTNQLLQISKLNLCALEQNKIEAKSLERVKGNFADIISRLIWNLSPVKSY